MINISYNNLINKCKMISFGATKPDGNTGGLKKSGNTQDVFEKSTKMNKSQEMNPQNKKYSQVNQDIDMKEISSQLGNKIKRLPLVMDRLMQSVCSYITGKKESDKFASDFVEDGVIVIKRAELGVNAEEYSEAYSPELKVIKEIAPVCGKFKSGEADKTELDSAVENSVTEYVNDQSERKRNFIA